MKKIFIITLGIVGIITLGVIGYRGYQRYQLYQIVISLGFEEILPQGTLTQQDCYLKDRRKTQCPAMRYVLNQDISNQIKSQLAPYQESHQESVDTSWTQGEYTSVQDPDDEWAITIEQDGEDMILYIADWR